MQTIAHQTTQPVEFLFKGEATLLQQVEDFLEPHALAITHEIGQPPVLKILVDEEDVFFVEALLKQQQDSGALPDALTYQQQRFAVVDWVAKVQEDFPPVRVGRFCIHRPEDKEKVPSGAFGLCIDAVSAFGTGEHDTTSGCLEMLQTLAKRQANYARILDMGAGTAILAIAAARLWPMANIAAFDNDKIAVRVSAENVKVNHLPKLYCAHSNGFLHRSVCAFGRYDLIIANILAVPLKEMAKDLRQALHPKGDVLLSGILYGPQVRMVAHAYQKQGLVLQKVMRHGKWAVLLLKAA